MSRAHEQLSFYLIGGDVSASPSPAMMSAAFAELSIDAIYKAVSIAEDSLTERFAQLTDRTFGGMNVTIPFKSAVIGFLGGLDPVSSRIGAVNVIKKEGGRLLGFNTDATGIITPLKPVLNGRLDHAVLVGSGGAARAFVDAMSQLSCRKVSVVVRDSSHAARFLGDMSKSYGQMDFDLRTFEDLEALVREEYSLLFNATPIGSRGIQAPSTLLRLIRPGVIVFDAVYRPVDTELILAARERGCNVVYGYEMLLQQGAAALEIWTKKKAPIQVMEVALLDALGQEARAPVGRDKGAREA